jgi:hypothetical protein
VGGIGIAGNPNERGPGAEGIGDAAVRGSVVAKRSKAAGAPGRGTCVHVAASVDLHRPSREAARISALTPPLEATEMLQVTAFRRWVQFTPPSFET